MKIQESAQNYLEAVMMISERQENVHAIDIVSHLGFSRATVSEMLKALRSEGYVDIDADNHITLTDKGHSIALEMYERHHTLADIFIKAGVSEETAYEDACRVEHYISDETYRCMKEYFGKR